MDSPLFIRKTKKVDQLFMTKLAGKMLPLDKKEEWPNLILSRVVQEYPFLSNYVGGFSLNDSKEEENGNFTGAIILTGLPGRSFLPVVVKNFELMPIDVFGFNDEFYPLSKGTFARETFAPEIGGDAKKLPDDFNQPGMGNLPGDDMSMPSHLTFEKTSGVIDALNGLVDQASVNAILDEELNDYETSKLAENKPLQYALRKVASLKTLPKISASDMAKKAMDSLNDSVFIERGYDGETYLIEKSSTIAFSPEKSEGNLSEAVKVAQQFGFSPDVLQKMQPGQAIAMMPPPTQAPPMPMGDPNMMMQPMGQGMMPPPAGPMGPAVPPQGDPNMSVPAASQGQSPMPMPIPMNQEQGQGQPMPVPPMPGQEMGPMNSYPPSQASPMNAPVDLDQNSMPAYPDVIVGEGGGANAGGMLMPCVCIDSASKEPLDPGFASQYLFDFDFQQIPSKIFFNGKNYAIQPNIFYFPPQELPQMPFVNASSDNPLAYSALNGDIAFVAMDREANDGAMFIIGPLTITAIVTERLLTAIKGIDHSGNNISVIPTPNIREIIPISPAAPELSVPRSLLAADGRTYFIPDSFPIIPLGKQVKVIGRDPSLEKTSSSNLSDFVITVCDIGAGEFLMRGKGIDKIAAAEGESAKYLPFTRAHYYLRLSGLNDRESVGVLKYAQEAGGNSIKVLGRRIVGTCSHEIVKRAAEKIYRMAHIPAVERCVREIKKLGQDIVKIAEEIPDSFMADKLLSTQLVNAKNISQYLDYYEDFKEGAKRLASLVLATRRGQVPLDEASLVDAMRAMDGVVTQIEILIQSLRSGDVDPEQ